MWIEGGWIRYFGEVMSAYGHRYELLEIDGIEREKRTDIWILYWSVGLIETGRVSRKVPW